MKKIAITPEKDSANEIQFICRILSEGFDYVHIRKPNSLLREVRNLIESIPQEFHSRLKLHGHFELINEFNIGGLHLNRRCPAPPANCTLTLSRSCHSIEELAETPERYEYIFLSPVFDSISKPGYKAAFNDKELTNELRKYPGKVVALGGITGENMNRVKEYGFAGSAFLGYLFNCDNMAVLSEHLKNISKI